MAMQYFSKTILEITALVPEEMQKLPFEGAAKNRMSVAVQELATPSVEFAMNLRSHPDANITKQAMRCISAWIRGEFLSTEPTLQILQAFLAMLDSTQDFDSVAEMVAEILRDGRFRNIKATVCLMTLDVLTAPSMRQRLDSAIQEQDESTVRLIAKMLFELAEAHVDYFLDNLTLAPQIGIALQMILQTVSFPGYFGADQEITQGSCIHSPSYCFVMTHIDVKDKFKGHRRECAETMLCCINVMDMQAMEIVVAAIGEKLSIKMSTQGQQELQAFHEAVDVNGGLPLAQVIQPPTLQTFDQLCRSYDSIGQLRNTLLTCLGSYSEWLAAHSECLPSAFEFILSSLPLKPSYMAAASALCDVCDACRISLKPYADQIIAACMAALPTVERGAHNKIIMSLSMIIQALPVELASSRLNMVLGGILTEMKSVLGVVESVRL
eukprot:jgi/Hompol1/1238/HPOL_004878-RA